jgi:hypothetical protein
MEKQHVSAFKQGISVSSVKPPGTRLPFLILASLVLCRDSRIARAAQFCALEAVSKILNRFSEAFVGYRPEPRRTRK